MFLGYHSNLDEDSTISPTGAQSLSYSRSCLFLPPTPRYPNSLRSPNPPQPCSLQHPPGATGEHLKAQTLSRIKLQTIFAIEILPPPPCSPKRINSALENASRNSSGEVPTASGGASGSRTNGARPSSAARENNHCLVIRNSRAVLGAVTVTTDTHTHTYTHTHARARASGHTPHTRACTALRGICRLIALRRGVNYKADLGGEAAGASPLPEDSGLSSGVPLPPRARRSGTAPCGREKRQLRGAEPSRTEPGRAGPGGGWGGAAAALPGRAMAPPSGLAVGPRLSEGAGAQCGGSPGRGGGLREPRCRLLSVAGLNERGMCAGLRCSALWEAYRGDGGCGRAECAGECRRCGGAPGV